jgi:transcriptional pleiotropic regulator of transition state genes
VEAGGIVRRVDEIGRIVIPISSRRSLDIKDGDMLEILIDNDLIVLRKQGSHCVFCGNAEDVTDFGGKKICKICLTKLEREL